MTAWARAECGALDAVALHVRVVEVQHSAAVITISLLVAEVDDNEIALAAAHGPRKSVLACNKRRPTSVMGQKASGLPERVATRQGGGAGGGAILTCVDAQMRIRGRRKCQPCEGPQEQRFGAAGPARGGHSVAREGRCLGGVRRQSPDFDVFLPRKPRNQHLHRQCEGRACRKPREPPRTHGSDRLITRGVHWLATPLWTPARHPP